jgi:tRNA(fMet)-specific endonuclease VapC
LGELAQEELAVSLFVLCELEAGAAGATHPERERERLRALVAPLAVSIPDDAVATLYGAQLADLARRGEAVATMDLLIAASALAEGASLVTRNRKHFERIRRLEILDY